MTRRDLSPLFAPRSVAVVGASNDLSKWGGDVAARLLRGPAGRPVYFINRKGGLVHDRRAYSSLRELPDGVDLVVLAMPADTFEGAVDDSLEAGAKALVVISAGLGELGPEGRLRERSAAERVRAAGAVMIGPNCPGIADTTSGLSAVAFLDVPPGSIGFISQSGGVGEEIVLRVQEVAQGFTRYVTLGNQADVGIVDVVWSFVGHQPTRVVAVYAEDLGDGRELAAAAAALVTSGTPLVLLAPGRSEASVRAARSHTGSLSSDAAVVDAFCRATGTLRVETPGELVELAAGLLSGRNPAGRRLAIVSDGGGHGAIAADAAHMAGLEVPRLSAHVAARLRDVLPANAATANPIDFAMASTDADAHARVATILAGSAEIDALLVGGEFGFWGARFPHLEREVEAEKLTARSLAQLASETGLPVVAATINADSPAASELRAGGVPVYREITSAVSVLARLAALGERSTWTMPVLPLRREPLTREDYWAAREALADAGLAFPAAVLAHEREEALSAARQIGYPVVVKTLGVLHKTDVGGVALDLADAAAVSTAWHDMTQRLAPSGFSIERMVKVGASVELIVGCWRDPRFGPLLLVGMGGVYTEVLGDTLMALAPAGENEVELLLRSLKGAPLLFGFRGKPRLCVEAAAQAAALLSKFAAAHPEVEEVEVNPLLVTLDGALALDARIVLAPARADADDHVDR